MGKGWISHDGPLSKVECKPMLKPVSQKKERKGLKRTKIKYKPDREWLKKEQELINQVLKRDSKCVICNGKGAHAHHIVHKKMGGRGALKEIIDNIHLRVTLCNECHDGIHHTASGVTPYYFYTLAKEQDLRGRLVLMELLIDEWAGSIPHGNSEIINEIKQRNKDRWISIEMGSIPIDKKLIKLFWSKILAEEVETSAD